MAKRSDMPPGADPTVITALKRFQAAALAEKDNRKQMKSDLQFYTADQWPDHINQNRQMDGRPCLTINRLPQFVRQITNRQRQNRPSLKFIPSHDGTEDVADI